jgi:hypothetical protein
MKIIHFLMLSAMLTILSLSGCAIVPSGGEIMYPSGEQIANMSYASEWGENGTVTLINGESRRPAAPGSASEIVVRLGDQIAGGQLSGRAVTALVLVSEGGGSGIFCDLALVELQDGEPVNITGTFLGDRVQVNALVIEDGTLSVNMLSHQTEDPLCCPTREETRRFRLVDEALVPAD